MVESKTFVSLSKGEATLTRDKTKVSWEVAYRRESRTRFFASGELAQQFCDKLIAEWKSDGFHEPPQPGPEPTPLHEISLFPGADPVSVRALGIRDAKPPYICNLKEEDVSYAHSDVLLVEGDLVIPGDFDASAFVIPDELGWDWSSDGPIVAISGDLTVGGRIRFLDGSPSLFVAGQTRAGTVEGGDCIICLKGRATIRHFISGHYNDGRMQIANAEVPFVISDRGHELGVGATDAITIDAYGDYCRDHNGYSYGRSDLETTFVPGVLKDDNIDFDAFYEHLEAGRSVFLKEPEPRG